MSKKYSMFVGRWQPLHDGHRWLIAQRLKEDKNVLICIRDVAPNDKNPWTADQVKQSITNEYAELIQEGKLRIIKIPDIESINYGRDVGYEVIEHIPPSKVKKISATKIREEMGYGVSK